MTTIELPHYVLTVINALRRAGYQGYAVGGCVRDVLMGRTPKDYDVTTDAVPDKVQAIFENTAPTGERYGTVTVFIGRAGVEVTTFRTESGYSDNRHPGLVSYNASLSDDLARRDFTINAMAFSPELGLVDPYHGKEDIEAQLVRAVGEPEQRFAEDALRILRGARFCATLGFEVESRTLLSMISSCPLLQNISGERIRDELSRIVMTQNPEALNMILMANGLEHIALGAAKDIVRLTNLPMIYLDRMTAFLLLCSKDIAKSLAGLRLSNHEVKTIRSITDLIGKQMIPDKIHLKKLLQNHEVEELLSAVRVKAALYDEDTALDCVDTIRLIEQSAEPYRISQLAVDGNDILSLHIAPAEDTGRILSFLLDCCIGSPQLNEKAALLALASSYQSDR